MHGPNCWAEHMECAQVRIASLERRVQELGVLLEERDPTAITAARLLTRQALRIEELEQVAVRLDKARAEAEAKCAGSS